MKGSVTASTPGLPDVRAGEGELFFIPDGAYCRTEWRGSPVIDFYSLHSYPREREEDRTRFALQKLPELPGYDVFGAIRRIFGLMGAGTYPDTLRALSVYLGFLAETAEVMTRETRKPCPAVLTEALRRIENNFRETPPVAELAAECHISESRLFHIFKAELGNTPVRYRNEYRVERAAALLRDTDMSAEEVSAAVGFSSYSYFCELFRRCTSLSPGAYRRMITR